MSVYGFQITRVAERHLRWADPDNVTIFEVRFCQDSQCCYLMAVLYTILP